jgi:hypothetical protein
MRKLLTVSHQYPQSLYPNWTPAQQQKSGLTKVIKHVSREPCTIFGVNVSKEGIFSADEDHVVTEENKEEYWKEIQQEEKLDGVRLRALFLQNLSGPVLQMCVVFIHFAFVGLTYS